jgi:trehalose/maltose hydrolase-like predicted phosphorylase
MSTPISPPPVTDASAKDLPAFVTNGFIGLRVLDIPLLPGVVLVNGFTGTHPQVQVEAAAQAPHPLAGDLSIDDVWLQTAPQQAKFLDQRYDFATGELTTRFRFQGNGASAQVEVLTLCSRKEPTLALQEIAIEVDAICSLTVRGMVDTSKVVGRMQARHVQVPGDKEHLVDGSMEWEAVGRTSTVGIAYATEFVGEPDVEREPQDWGIETSLATDYRLRARPGKTYRLRQIASMVPSVVHHDPDHAAVRLASRAADQGFDSLRADNRLAWEELWKGRVLIDARDDRWQALADAAFFYLNGATHPSAPSSTSMYGLAQWNDYHYYYGHVMWDIEAFSVPPLLLLQPDAARALLEFRIKTLDAARGNAKLHGRRGIQFPWESGPANGEEAAPGAGKASWHEDHVSVDVAWAFAQYAHATGDRRFLSEDASRVLYGVADWITSRVTPVDGHFEFKKAMGIAERRLVTDNDAYTIMAARTVLCEAIACAERLGQPILPAWQRVADGLEVARMSASKAVRTHDGFHPREEKGSTPGPLAGIFPLWYDLPSDVVADTLDYYLKLAPGYVGSPMLSALYGVWACWAGDRSLAARLYEEGYADLVAGRFLQTLEQSPTKYPDNPPSGPFFANLGGFLMGLIYGLPGLRLGPGPAETWPSRPVVLPAGWKSIEIERAWVRMQPARIVAEHGASRATIEYGED